MWLTFTRINHHFSRTLLTKIKEQGETWLTSSCINHTISVLSLSETIVCRYHFEKRIRQTLSYGWTPTKTHENDLRAASVKMVSCSPISLYSRTGKRARLSVSRSNSWDIAPSGTVYALTASCTVATQKAPKHCTLNRIILPVLRGVPLNPDHLSSRGTFCTADGDAAPDAKILSKNEDDANDCGEPVQIRALPGRERLACGPACTLTWVVR